MITKFILILTITGTGSYGSNSSSINHIEMTSIELCMKAGDFWLKDFRKTQPSGRFRFSALCVEK
jgi:hypothetical protein